MSILQTLETNLFNLQGTFNNFVQETIDQLVADINTDLGTSYSMAYAFQRDEESTLPYIRTWFYNSGLIANGNRNEANCQIDLFTETSLEAPDLRFPNLIMQGFLVRSGLHTRKAIAITDKQTKDYYNNVMSPQSKKTFRIQAGMWIAIPEPETNVLHHLLDVRIRYK